MPLEPFELRDYRVAGRDQRGRAIRVGARHKDLDKPPVGGLHLGVVIGSGTDQVVDHISGMADALGRNPAAMRIAEQKARGLGQLRGAGRLAMPLPDNKSSATVNARVGRMEISKPSTSPLVGHSLAQCLKRRKERALY